MRVVPVRNVDPAASDPGHPDAPAADAAWVRRARGGDRLAFDALVRAHARVAGRLAFRLVGNAEDAEDVVQDAMTRAFQNLAALRDDAAFRPWLLHITFNVAHDLLRTRARRRPIDGLQPGERSGDAAAAGETAARGSGPCEVAAARDAESLLRRALDDLPPRQKIALTLKVYEGLSHSAIATVLGTSVTAARVYLALARRSLRRRFATRIADGGGGPAPGDRR